MARVRDYAAEYARRQANARAQGWAGYWQQRQARTIVRGLGESASRLKVEANLKKLGKDRGRWRQWREGLTALRRGDFEEAERIARAMGFSDRDQGPARDIFFYH